VTVGFTQGNCAKFFNPTSPYNLVDCPSFEKIFTKHINRLVLHAIAQCESVPHSYCGGGGATKLAAVSDPGHHCRYSKVPNGRTSGVGGLLLK